MRRRPTRRSFGGDAAREASRLAYFAFDILHLDGRDLRRCPLVERKAVLAELLRSAGCARLLYVDHVDKGGDRLLDAVREVGAEGIVAKRRAGRYRSGPSRDWLKTKCSAVGKFVITGFRDAAPGEIEAITVAEVVGDKLAPVGEIQFGVGRRLRNALDVIRLEPSPGSQQVPVRPMLMAEIKYFGRHRNGMIRDGVVRAVAAIGFAVDGRRGQRNVLRPLSAPGIGGSGGREARAPAR